MTPEKSEFPDDKTKTERQKDLSEPQIKDLELAGGAEGGMQAGSAGGPGEKDSERSTEKKPAGSDARGEARKR